MSFTDYEEQTLETDHQTHRFLKLLCVSTDPLQALSHIGQVDCFCELSFTNSIFFQECFPVYYLFI